MTLIELARQVRTTRLLQKEYFKTPAAERPPDLIKRCKQSERFLDTLVEEVLGGRELNLFDRKENP
jgi:hypothetical protein